MSVTKLLQTLVKWQQAKVFRYLWTLQLATFYTILRNEFGMNVSQVRPDIILAGIPIYSVNKIGHTASDELLKYRSMGGVFLAHQKGGKKTFHFRAFFFGPSRFLFIAALEALQQVGTETTKKIEQNATTLKDGGQLTYSDPKKSVIDPESISKTNVQAPLIEYTNHGEFKDQIYAFHRTFPIITETRIYMNMYMETLVIKRDIKYGRDIVEVQCAFREYDEPTEYQTTGDDVDEKKRKFYRIYIPEDKLKMMRFSDLSINFAWALKNTINDMGFTGERLYKKERGKFAWELGTLATLYGIHRITQKIKYG